MSNWERESVSTGSRLESRYGYCRAVRVGPIINVAGTVASWPDGTVDADPGAQARRALEIIEAALVNLGASAADVVRTRVFVTNAAFADAVGLAHVAVFGANPPAMSMVVVAALLDPRWLVEIEADAVALEKY